MSLCSVPCSLQRLQIPEVDNQHNLQNCSHAFAIDQVTRLPPILYKLNIKGSMLNTTSHQTSADQCLLLSIQRPDSLISSSLTKAANTSKGTVVTVHWCSKTTGDNGAFTASTATNIAPSNFSLPRTKEGVVEWNACFVKKQANDENIYCSNANTYQRCIPTAYIQLWHHCWSTECHTLFPTCCYRTPPLCLLPGMSRQPT